jgi:hypothetical protein
VASFSDGEADKWLEAAARRSQVLEDKRVSKAETSSSRHLLDTTIGQVDVAS